MLFRSILTTHYIEEAEQMADRVGVINHGELILVEEKRALMQKLGKKQMTLQLAEPLGALPPSLQRFGLELGQDGRELTYDYDTRGDHSGITTLLDALRDANIAFTDLDTTQTSLEDIFVNLVQRPK